MMKAILLGTAAALTMSFGAMAADVSFMDKQDMGTVRAPKLVGVAVYDNNNKSVGKIDDLLLDKDGSVKAVVIGVGGFLGIGKKDIAVPYSAIQWQTEERTVAVNDTAAGSPAGSNTMGSNTTGAGTTASTTTSATGTTANGGMAANKPAERKIDAAATEAYQGYPDRAVLNVSQDQLKSAPEFKYASNPMTTSNGAAGDAPATKQ